MVMLGGRPAMFSMALAACGVLEDALLNMDLEEVGYMCLLHNMYMLLSVGID